MNEQEKKALGIIKNVLDASVKSGLYKSLDETMIVTEAWNFVCSKFETKPQEVKETNEDKS
jgi:hypothetical protein